MSFDSSFLHKDNWSQENLVQVNQMRQTLPYQMQMPNPIFDKENLETLPDHKWMANKEMTLVTQDEYPDLLEDFLPMFESLLSTVSNTEPMDLEAKCAGKMGMPKGYVEQFQPKVAALDLETTGLDKTIRVVGGAPTLPSGIVGICLASSPTKAFYIPTLHNQKDGVMNYPYDHAMGLLRALQDKRFVMVYHNAQYDREVLEVNNIDLCEEYLDTMVLLDNMGYKEKYFTVGLKQMSSKLLRRKMLEIKDISGEKKFIPLRYYPAKSLTVYGCSDAMNTFGLLKHVVESPLCPFNLNNFAMRLDWKCNDYTRWMLRPGMPIDVEHLSTTIRTTLRRRILVTEYFQKHVSDTVEIGSAEKVGIFLGDILKQHFMANHPHKDSLGESDMFEDFQGKMKELFYCDVKTKKLKSGTVKITYSSGADVLGAFKNIHKRENKMAWLPKKLYPLFVAAAECIDVYRSVVHDLGVLASMYRYAYTDDLNFHRLSVGLKFNGTVTNRYSNMGGKGSRERYVISRGVKKTNFKFVEADATAGLNLQGVNSDPIRLSRALKVTKAPKEFLETKETRDNETELRLRLYLEQM